MAQQQQQPAQVQPRGSETQELRRQRQAQQQTQQQAQPTQPQPGQQQAIAVSELVDETVYGAQGERIGTIQQILVDRSGQEHAVISFGGFLGLGEDQVIIPLQQLQMRNDDIYAPGLNESQLQAMPRYRMNDPNYSVAEGQRNVRLRSQ